MSFTIRSFSSKERYSLEKFMSWEVDVYDVINSPFLDKIKDLPVDRYYNVNNGHKDIDMISQDAYGNPFYAFLIMYYNDISTEVISENITLKLFSLTDLDKLYFDLSNGIM